LINKHNIKDEKDLAEMEAEFMKYSYASASVAENSFSANPSLLALAADYPCPVCPYVGKGFKPFQKNVADMYLPPVTIM